MNKKISDIDMEKLERKMDKMKEKLAHFQGLVDMLVAPPSATDEEKSKWEKEKKEIKAKVSEILERIQAITDELCRRRLGELKFGDVIRLKNGKTVMVMEIRDNKDTPIWYVEIEGNESGGCRWGDIESKEVIMDG